MVQGSKNIVTKAPTKKAPLGLVILEIILFTFGLILQTDLAQRKSLNFKQPKTIAAIPKILYNKSLTEVKA